MWYFVVKTIFFRENDFRDFSFDKTFSQIHIIVVHGIPAHHIKCLPLHFYLTIFFCFQIFSNSKEAKHNFFGHSSDQLNVAENLKYLKLPKLCIFAFTYTDLLQILHSYSELHTFFNMFRLVLDVFRRVFLCA
jgi:hypothetical protein